MAALVAPVAHSMLSGLTCARVNGMGVEISAMDL